MSNSLMLLTLKFTIGNDRPEVAETCLAAFSAVLGVNLGECTQFGFAGGWGGE